mmetsp:Transcript_105257/g.277975  ORF Transcript_105257/g.277975 Transcript_105257/m.277975 type:complete len:374 (+) Transcript_105257:414-1535(+)
MAATSGVESVYRCDGRTPKNEFKTTLFPNNAVRTFHIALVLAAHWRESRFAGNLPLGERQSISSVEEAAAADTLCPPLLLSGRLGGGSFLIRPLALEVLDGFHDSCKPDNPCAVLQAPQEFGPVRQGLVGIWAVLQHMRKDRRIVGRPACYHQEVQPHGARRPVDVQTMLYIELKCSRGAFYEEPVIIREIVTCFRKPRVACKSRVKAGIPVHAQPEREAEDVLVLRCIHIPSMDSVSTWAPAHIVAACVVVHEKAWFVLQRNELTGPSEKITSMLNEKLGAIRIVRPNTLDQRSEIQIVWRIGISTTLEKKLQLVKISSLRWSGQNAVLLAREIPKRSLHGHPDFGVDVGTGIDEQLHALQAFIAIVHVCSH